MEAVTLDRAMHQGHTNGSASAKRRATSPSMVASSVRITISPNANPKSTATNKSQSISSPQSASRLSRSPSRGSSIYTSSAARNTVVPSNAAPVESEYGSVQALTQVQEAATTLAVGVAEHDARITALENTVAGLASVCTQLSNENRRLALDNARLRDGLTAAHRCIDTLSEQGGERERQVQQALAHLAQETASLQQLISGLAGPVRLGKTAEWPAARSVTAGAHAVAAAARARVSDGGPAQLHTTGTKEGARSTSGSSSQVTPGGVRVVYDGPRQGGRGGEERPPPPPPNVWVQQLVTHPSTVHLGNSMSAPMSRDMLRTVFGE